LVQKAQTSSQQVLSNDFVSVDLLKNELKKKFGDLYELITTLDHSKYPYRGILRKSTAVTVSSSTEKTLHTTHHTPPQHTTCCLLFAFFVSKRTVKGR
jgi:hypothetical protein